MISPGVESKLYLYPEWLESDFQASFMDQLTKQKTSWNSSLFVINH